MGQQNKKAKKVYSSEQNTELLREESLQPPNRFKSLGSPPS